MKTQRRILVVDDDPVVGKSFERVLASKGYAVINCSSGEEALSKLQNEEYDAVFTDLKMPGMHGMELARKVKESQAWMPVVIVTGFSSEAYQIEAKQIGVSDFLNKPLSPEMIEQSADFAMLAKEAFTVSEVVAPVEAIEVAAQESFAKNVALFFAAPFIGLAYVIAMPFVGFGVLAYFAGKAVFKR